MKITYILVIFLFAVFTNCADAVTVGNAEIGWQIDFDQVSQEQKKRFGWFDDEIKITGFKKFSNTYTAPGVPDWSLSGKVVAIHGTKGPAFFSITELLNGSTIEDVKKVHFRTMSGAKGFKERNCLKSDQGALLCEVLLDNWLPAKAFYADFYEWKVGEKTFVLVVRNAQPSPDKTTPEAAIKTLIALIQ